MIKLENTEVMGWDHAIRGMRNPMNSWDKRDSVWGCTSSPNDNSRCSDCQDIDCSGHGEYRIGPNDYDLMMRLAKGGPVHAKYRRMITVYVDITAPLYWWKEFDTYKVGTVANSCSTMHKIAAKEFTLEDFSHEHLFDGYDRRENEENNMEIYENPLLTLEYTIRALNHYRRKFLEASSKKLNNTKSYWWQMIQLLPSSYNQKRTVMMNYEVLVNIYNSRKNHKLDEWHTFCEWIESLPYSDIITKFDNHNME